MLDNINTIPEVSPIASANSNAPAILFEPVISTPPIAPSEDLNQGNNANQIPKPHESVVPSKPPQTSAPLSTPNPEQSTFTEPQTLTIPVIGALLAKARATIQTKKLKKFIKILSLMEQKGRIKNADVSKTLRCSNATATRYLDELEKQGKIKQIGKRAGSFYELIR